MSLITDAQHPGYLGRICRVERFVIEARKRRDGFKKREGAVRGSSALSRRVPEPYLSRRASSLTPFYILTLFTSRRDPQGARLDQVIIGTNFLDIEYLRGFGE